jgi:hypothetical protein
LGAKAFTKTILPPDLIREIFFLAEAAIINMSQGFIRRIIQDSATFLTMGNRLLTAFNAGRQLLWCYGPSDTGSMTGVFH